MKKLVFFLVCLFTMQVVVADNDKPVTFEQLPQAAQSFVKKHFADRNVAFSKMDKDIFDVTYDVMFVNGDKLEFDKQGNWKEMKCKHGLVPETAVPAQIVKYVKTNSKMDKDIFDVTYDVMFVNGDKLEFDKQGNWKEMKCKHGLVPETAVPAQIVKYVKTNYPEAKILQIEKDRYEYEVKLSNFWDLKFDLKFNLIDMDRDDD